MGVTKTFCYCKSPGRCKPEEVSRDILSDDGHWADMRQNCLAYLEEPVCVPGGGDGSVPVPVVATLQKYLLTLSDLLDAGNAEAPEPSAYLELVLKCSEACSSVQDLTRFATSSQLGSTIGFDEADQELDPSSTQTEDLAAVRTAEIGSVLARACARASGELVLAMQKDLDDYRAHHHVLVVDLAHEMQSLALGAMRAVNAEKLHHVEHDHQLQEAGV